MARNKEFDKDKAVSAAIDVFREHGFEGTSTEMLVRAMKIGRQSLYDTFGDKWALYQSTVERYSSEETEAHVAMLRSKQRAVDGITAMIERVVARAQIACLGVNSICEFGQSRPELNALHRAADNRLRRATVECIKQAQVESDVEKSLPAEALAGFLIASIAGIRIAARGGATHEDLETLGRLAIRAIR
ncbi:TetR/AcrR family transcriptional regulator [Ensifer sp. ENS07]|uniref:TetR/AcrR family transcriptional regulator n=1 Tax=Ensifer sp. ENS07 TaxID=2769274 RepID=UPI001786A889|nr:TetR/AcrR family transcriptional regulator [Ensifer sp. ENS07]MBD9638987.1 TetR/AcrR family transcriptional regulator [Ensifer sp. ENS07]